MLKRVLVRLDADSDIGLGHAVRTANLLKQIPGLDLWVSGRSDVLRTFFPSAQILDEVHALDDLARLAQQINAHGLVIDHPDTARQAHALRAICDKPIILIDDYGNIPSSHLVINGNILSEYHQYEMISHEDRILAGGRYALIHPAFQSSSNDTDRLTECLLIVIGSGENSYRWLDFLLETKPFAKWSNVILVTGHAHPYPEKISEICSQIHVEHRHALTSYELASYVHSCTAGLTTGGMIVYESLAAGLPLMAFPQMGNLVDELNFFSEHDALINLGPHHGFDDRHIHSDLELLRQNPSARIQLQSAGKALVDGSGIQRCATAITNLLDLNGGSRR